MKLNPAMSFAFSAIAKYGECRVKKVWMFSSMAALLLLLDAAWLQEGVRRRPTVCVMYSWFQHQLKSGSELNSNGQT